MANEHIPVPHREEPPEGASLQERVAFYQSALDIMLPRVADGQYMDKLSDIGWPLYNLVKNDIKDTTNSLGLVPEDIWKIYEDLEVNKYGPSA